MVSVFPFVSLSPLFLKHSTFVLLYVPRAVHSARWPSSDFLEWRSDEPASVSLGEAVDRLTVRTCLVPCSPEQEPGAHLLIPQAAAQPTPAAATSLSGSCKLELVRRGERERERERETIAGTSPKPETIITSDVP
ncbi:hypothetical protein VTK26DRAFT_4281 [Humicola hyalothermophila]